MTYVDLSGLKTWYETAGSGPPLVLLHGGLSGAEAWFAQRDALAAAGFGVYLPERRGHAHSPDVPGPLTYQVMADDTVAFLEKVVDGPAHLVGWSDGAVVAALVAAQRPGLVNRLVLIGQYFNSAGKAQAGLLDLIFGWRDDPPAFLRGHYDQVSPDGPGHFPVFFAKSLDMIAREPEIDLADLAGIQAETLVLQGDRDEVTLAHSAQVAAAIRGGRLAVLPGTHALPIESPAVVNDLLISFLRDGPPRAAWDPAGE